MTDYELLRNMYPEWESPIHPILYLIQIFLAVVIFLVVPYIYIKFIEGRLQVLREKIQQRINVIRQQNLV